MSDNVKRPGRYVRTLWPCLVFWCAPALADPLAPECDPESPDRCAVFVRKGEPAPYDGQLLTPDLALDLGQRAEGCDQRQGLEVERVRKLAAIDLEREQTLRRIDAEGCGRQIKIVRTHLDRCLDRPVWTEPWLVASASAALTLVAVVGLWWLAVQTVQATSG